MTLASINDHKWNKNYEDFKLKAVLNAYRHNEVIKEVTIYSMKQSSQNYLL